MYRSVEHRRESQPEALAICCFEGEDLPVGTPPEVQAAVRRPEFKGETGQVVVAFPNTGPRIFVLGLGQKDNFTTSVMREAGLALAKQIGLAELDSVHFDFKNVPDAEENGQGLGVVLAMEAFTAKSMPGSATNDQGNQALKVSALEETFDAGLAKGVALGASVNECRRLVNTPPNIATPLWMADQTQQMAEGTELKVTVLKGEDLKKETMTGLMNVGMASVNAPCLIRLEWRPKGTEGQKPVVLLGKTITYDTGGLSIKGKTGMPGMKYDKAGGCAVFGAMHAVANVVKPDFPVVGLLVAAENCISNNAYRPDDVITFRNGVTVEVTNTDAEGRLVLADGLCWACDKEDPEAIVDLATLTGGVVTALGGVYAGAFSLDNALLDSLKDAGEATSEKIWQLPLNEDYRKMMKSEIADIVNSVPGGKAHPVQGASFLSYFVKEGTPWTHIDIAGVSSSKAENYASEGPSGFGVRLLAEFLTQRGK